MDSIADFFKKFSNIKPTARIITKEFVDLLNSKNIPVSEDDVVYSRNIIYIKARQIIKNEIFFIKESLLDDINKRIQNVTITDIR